LRSLYRYSVAYPVRTLSLAALITLLALPGLLRLELRTDGHALVSPSAREVAIDAAVRDRFGIEDPLVVLVQSDDPEGIFNPRTLRLLQDLSRRVEAVEGVGRSRLSSLDTEPSDHYREGTLEFRRFLEPLPETPEECQLLRDDLEAIGIFTGTLVAADGSATAILVGTPADRDRTEFYEDIRGAVAAEAGGATEKVDVLGAPVAEALLGLHILEDLGVPASLFPVGEVGRTSSEEASFPRSLYELRRFIARHVGLLPLAVLTMGLVFLVSFRRLAAAALPLVEVGAALVFVFGLMGWLGVPVYLTITVMPIILTAVGLADEIHIFSLYARLRRERPEEPPLETVLETMDEMRAPVTKTSITTAVAFLSFGLSPLEPVRAFGVLTAVGVIFCLFFSLTAIPAMLVLIRPQRVVPGASTGTAGATPSARASRPPRLSRLAATVIRNRYPLLGAAVLMVALSPLGLNRLFVQDSWVDGFDPESNFYRATQAFNEKFFGTHLLVLQVDTGDDVHTGELSADLVEDHAYRLPLEPGLEIDPKRLVSRRLTISLAGTPVGEEESKRSRVWRSWIESARLQGDELVLTTPRVTGSARFLFRLADDERVTYEIAAGRLLVPDVLQETEALSQFLRQRTDLGVGGVLGPTDYLTTTRFIVKKRRPAARRLPDTPREVENLWRLYGRVRGTKRLREVVDEDYNRALVTVYLKNANFIDTSRVMSAVRAYEKEHLTPKGIRLDFAGDVAVSQTLIGGIVRTQVGCLLGSLLGVIVVVSLLSRSVRWGIYCVLPSALAVLAVFAGMGWSGVPLGVATSMFGGMTLGIGVDYAIHLLERQRLARERGLDVEASIADAVSMAGPAILVDALAVGLGFGLLTLSQVPTNARLGSIALVAIVTCLCATLLLLPALLRVLPLPAAGWKKRGE